MTYSVFISSTYLDNVERRKAVEDAILRAGMRPIGMERFGASTDPAVDECVRMAGEADLLVGIIAWRYGWIPDGSDVSITEMEYNTAKERLIFLPDDSVRVNPDADLDQGTDRGKKLEKLDAFKKRIAGGPMPGRFNDKNLEAVVLQALTKWEKEQQGPKPGPRSGPEKKPSRPAFDQLRIGDIEDLVGREDELAWLKEQLIDRDTLSAALTSITGSGGMGKTFLARIFAEQYKNQCRFLPIYLGDTAPFDAGLQLLAGLGISTADIDDKAKLEAAMDRFYSEGSGIVVLDDVRSEDARLLMPKTTR